MCGMNTNTDRRDAITAEREAMRNAIFTFGCYSPDMTFTLADVVKAFGFRRDRAWLRIQELKRQKLVTKLPTTKDRNAQYRIATEDK